MANGLAFFNMATKMLRLFSSSTPLSLDPLISKSKSIKGIVKIPDIKETSSSSNALVILVGWAMSKQKHVGKYSQVYNTFGLPTLSVTPNIFHTWDILSQDKYTSNLLQVVDSTFNGSVILHLFSGAGFLILPHLSESTVNYKNINLKGIVFDCAPSLFGHASGMAAAKMALNQGGINQLTYYLSTTAGTMIDKLKGETIRQRMAAALRRPSLDGVPQLYLYSNTDTVMPLSVVQDTIKLQKDELGRDVETVMFDGADHVKLLQSHPEKYRDAIGSFVESRLV